MTALQELIAQKRQTFDEEQKTQEVEVLYWKGKVDELYQQVIAWLKPLVDDGSVTVERVPYDDTEADTRTSEDTIDNFVITFFNDEKIEFVPVGLNIVGGYGRVDLELGLRKLMIILKEKDGNWFFTERYGLAKAPLYEFTQTSFEQLVTEFVEKF